MIQNFVFFKRIGERLKSKSLHTRFSLFSWFDIHTTNNKHNLRPKSLDNLQTLYQQNNNNLQFQESATSECTLDSAAEDCQTFGNNTCPLLDYTSATSLDTLSVESDSYLSNCTRPTNITVNSISTHDLWNQINHIDTSSSSIHELQNYRRTVKPPNHLSLVNKKFKDTPTANRKDTSSKLTNHTFESNENSSNLGRSSTKLTIDSSSLSHKIGLKKYPSKKFKSAVSYTSNTNSNYSPSTSSLYMKNLFSKQLTDSFTAKLYYSNIKSNHSSSVANTHQNLNMDNIEKSETVVSEVVIAKHRKDSKSSFKLKIAPYTCQVIRRNKNISISSDNLADFTGK